MRCVGNVQSLFSLLVNETLFHIPYSTFCRLPAQSFTLMQWHHGSPWPIMWWRKLERIWATWQKSWRTSKIIWFLGDTPPMRWWWFKRTWNSDEGELTGKICLHSAAVGLPQNVVGSRFCAVWRTNKSSPSHLPSLPSSSLPPSVPLSSLPQSLFLLAGVLCSPDLKISYIEERERRREARERWTVWGYSSSSQLNRWEQTCHSIYIWTSAQCLITTRVDDSVLALFYSTLPPSHSYTCACTIHTYTCPSHVTLEFWGKGWMVVDSEVGWPLWSKAQSKVSHVGNIEGRVRRLIR